MFGLPLLLIVLGIAMLGVACVWWNFYFKLEARRFGHAGPANLVHLVIVTPFLSLRALMHAGPILSAVSGIVTVIAGVVMFFL